MRPAAVHGAHAEYWPHPFFILLAAFYATLFITFAAWHLELGDTPVNWHMYSRVVKGQWQRLVGPSADSQTGSSAALNQLLQTERDTAENHLVSLFALLSIPPVLAVRPTSMCWPNA